MGGIPWTKEEDQLLRKCVEQYGEGKWHRVPFLAGLNRCRKSCRLRWLNYLRPNIKRGSFDEHEVDLIIKLHKLLGNRWSLVAARLPGRTGNDVKNYWNCHLSKKLNAQETEDDKKKNNAATSSSSKWLFSTNTLDTPIPSNINHNICQPEEGSSTSSFRPKLCNNINIEADGQINQIFETDNIHEENQNNVPGVLEEHNKNSSGFNMHGDFPMDDDFPFDDQQVEEYHHHEDDVDQDNNKWEWADSILDDMDLWNES